MSLLLNEEQQLLKDTAKEFVQKNAPVSYTHLTLPTILLV